MRITSLLLALTVVAGLWYWFVGRHDGQAPTAAAVVAEEPVATMSDAASDAAANVPSEDTAPRENAQANAADAGAEPSPEVVPPVSVVAMQSRARETTAQLVLRGRTTANRNVIVSAETQGRVISEPLRRGSAVDAGQILCKLEPGIRAAELAEAEAALAEAQAEMTAAKRLERKGFTAQMTLKTRRAQVEAAQARRDRVKWDIAQLDIRAPFPGVLESDTAEIGALLTPGAQCANVIDLSKVKVTGFVAEQDVDRLAIGQPAHAKLINGDRSDGQITFISRRADAQTRTYEVQVTLPNPKGRIRDGMTTELLISLPADIAHLLPQSALSLDDAGRMGVRVDVDGRATFMPVRILRDEANGVWVDGLPEVANVIVVGQEFVRDGRAVISTPVDPADITAAMGAAMGAATDAGADGTTQ